MADVKFSGLTVGTSPIADQASLLAISEYDGVSAYTSKSYTLTEFRDIIYVMEAEDKFTFDSSGTNKTLTDDASSSVQIDIGASTSNSYEITTDAGGFTDGWFYLDETSGSLGADTTDISVYNAADATFPNVVKIQVSGTERFRADATGLGFFNTTPVAKPTVSGSRGGNAALADLLTELATLGLITDSTSA
jgi:hypothetical protein